MVQMALFLLTVLLVAFGFSWLSDQPGSILVNFAGYERNFTPVEFVIVFIALFAVMFSGWLLFQRIVNIPAVLSRFFKRRREKRGLEALSAGLIAVGIGERYGASRYATQARKTLPNEPLTALLRAQSAQLTGDKDTARRIYEAMLSAPDTELLGLRGLFLEAQQENEEEAAYQFAKQAAELNPKLQWSVVALFQFQCKKAEWREALDTLDIARQYKHFERSVIQRRRAVLLTAQAAELEQNDADKALELALEAQRLAVDLIPAAAIAGRILASKGNTGKAAKVVAKTWKQAPHPDLALVYAYARPGDSPQDRLQRMQTLASMMPHSAEGPIAVALAGIEAKEWDVAKAALRYLVEDEPSARVCTLMARLEGEQGDQGRMREWLARAVRAPRDPVWVADGFVSDRWLPVSPVTGALDCFEWKVPVEALGAPVKYEPDELLPMEMVVGTVEPKQPQSEEIAQDTATVTPTPESTEVPPVADGDLQSEAKEVVVKEEQQEREPVVSTEKQTNNYSPEKNSLDVADEASERRDLVHQPEEKLPKEADKRNLAEEVKQAELDKQNDLEGTPLRVKPAYAQRPAPEPEVETEKQEPNIYISPRAPDDPGVSPEEEYEAPVTYVAKSE